MLHIVVAGEEKRFSTLLNILEKHKEFGIQIARTGQDILDLMDRTTIELVIVDEEVDGTSGEQLVRQIVSKNPLVYCCLVSSLPHDDFHEQTEGLGVLMQLSPNPGSDEVFKMLDRLEKISVIQTKVENNGEQES